MFLKIIKNNYNKRNWKSKKKVIKKDILCVIFTKNTHKEELLDHYKKLS